MTVYYVLHQLGPHGAGDVLSFSPEQIGAGVDISHLTSIGAIRTATPLLAPPLAPTLATAATGGTVAAGDYLVKISYVTAVGETTPSPSATVTTSGATSTLTVTSPAPATNATGWYGYVSQRNGSTLTRQQTAPTPIGTDLVLTAPPTASGPAPLGTNTSGEAARTVPAQIQATHAPQGVGVFTSNGVPDGTTYAGIAAYGSVCWDVAVSPPAIYVNTGTIGAPNWTASGGSLPGLMSDGASGVGLDGRLLTGSLSTAARPAGLDGLNPDPTYDPIFSYVSGDLATSGSYWHANYVRFFTWTPTRSGTVTLLPPGPLSAVVDETDYLVFAGSVIGVDVPSLDGTGTHGTRLAFADAYYVDIPAPNGAQNQDGTTFAVTAGQVYTVAVRSYFTTNPGSALTDVIALHTWVFSTQQLGGQAQPVAWLHPTGPNSTSEGLNTTASGAQSHASGNGSVASGDDSEASGRNNTASGPQSSARGDANIVSGFASDVSGSANVVSGQTATGGGSSNTVSGDTARSHGGGNTVSGTAAAADGSLNIVSGDGAQGMGHNNRAPGDRSLAMGHRAVAGLPGEVAHGSGYNVFGNAQYSRLVGHIETADATPTSLTLDAGNGAVAILVPDGQTWQVMAQVSATRHDVPGTVATFLIKGAVAAAGGAARLIGSPTIETWADADASAWAATFAVSGANLELLVTGEAAQTVYWFGTLHLARIAA